MLFRINGDTYSGEYKILRNRQAMGTGMFKSELNIEDYFSTSNKFCEGGPVDYCYSYDVLVSF